VSVQNQESELSFICVFEVSILSLSTNFYWIFGTVPTVWYLFCFSMGVFELLRQCGICFVFQWEFSNFSDSVVFVLFFNESFRTSQTVWYLFCFSLNKYHTVWEVRKLPLKNKTNTTLSEKFENSHWKTKQIPHCLRSSKTPIEKQNKYHTVWEVRKLFCFSMGVFELLRQCGICFVFQWEFSNFSDSVVFVLFFNESFRTVWYFLSFIFIV
jgi:hypothetical protein